MIAIELPFESPERARARRSDPVTSVIAADSVDVAGLEKVVLDLLKASKEPLTTRELASRSGIDLVSISPRLRPLANRNLVKEVRGVKFKANGAPVLAWTNV